MRPLFGHISQVVGTHPPMYGEDKEASRPSGHFVSSTSLSQQEGHGRIRHSANNAH